MNLFDKNVEKLNIIDSHDRIKTPLGDIFFSVNYGVYSITTMSGYKTQILKENTILRWENDSLEAELLTHAPTINIPDGMSVDNCIAVAWRVRAKKAISTPVEFNCIWNNNYLWNNYGANSGEFLDAQTWDNGIHFVTIGTEDGEYIQIRAMMDRMIPKCLKSKVDLGLVQYSKLGLSVPVPSIAENEICHIQFVISWGNSEIATWYAAGVTTDELFR